MSPGSNVYKGNGFAFARAAVWLVFVVGYIFFDSFLEIDINGECDIWAELSFGSVDERSVDVEDFFSSSAPQDGFAGEFCAIFPAAELVA